MTTAGSQPSPIPRASSASSSSGRKTIPMADLVPSPDAHILEELLLAGDLAKLSPQERLDYYAKVCSSLGLNPLTKPFEYIKLNGKLQLYARRDCTEQLRKLHNVSITEMRKELI